ncbi:hypothetical protein COY27_06700 [Candidatus Woesearchaeota archaeon CG_4_10_14_0_2_um_filter_33_13]|nr:MAG: hypothetical protein COY27_06700 [Candidatus Woesearchaeota archaeon CG_4_10_14_0_2_um_filter_33_13]
MLNEKELEIIKHLRKDARTSLLSISDVVQMPTSTIYDKINKMKKEKIITGYTALVDFKKLGINHHSKVVIKVIPEHKNELLRFLQGQENVNSIYHINSGYDFMVEVLSKDIKDHLELVEKIKNSFNITEIYQYQVVDEVIREKVFKLD